MLRHQSLIAILEQNGWLLKSYIGFANDFPGLYQQYKDVCIDFEAYEMMPSLSDTENLDKQGMVWVRPLGPGGAVGPLILERKEAYNKVETAVISSQTSIPLAVFEQVRKATNVLSFDEDARHP